MVTVVVGGQYGSEGKGKIAQYLAAQRGAAAVVRVGGSNSGHTGFRGADRYVLRQLPTAALLPDVLCLLGPGSYIDADVLLREIDEVGLPNERLLIDPGAFLITEEDKRAEAQSGQVDEIGSTGSGTGAAVIRRVTRHPQPAVAVADPRLKPFLKDTHSVLRNLVQIGSHVVIEGTQGFGLSLLHSPHYPFVTSRDTSAAAAVAEAGLSPRDVDEIVLVLRTFPIRVGGNSGPLRNEIDWPTITRESGADEPLAEYTSVTGRLRRVARFDPDIVRRAIEVNSPSLIALNHLDYVDAHCRDLESLTDVARAFVADVRDAIEAPIDLIGVGPSSIVQVTPYLASSMTA